ncbi:hypothetical protein FPV67DRAFT_791548 [Lyophyllum atratum]|nr:hypothetical protein FPV67DRAFT_791548 [Lyophyllum atratum]
MSLLKLPLLASVAWATHTTMTAPNPPPSADERLPPTGLEHLAAVVPPISKIFFWSATLAEMGVMLANYLDGTRSFSQHILRLLVRTEQPETPNLRITFPFLVGWSLALLGALLRQHCYRTLGRQFTFELSIRRDHHLVTQGPDAYVRHPSYAGALLAGGGGLLCLVAPGSWLRECSGLWLDEWNKLGVVVGAIALGAALVARAVVGRMEREDAMLRAQFGEEWERWAKDVPWKLIPYVY